MFVETLFSENEWEEFVLSHPDGTFFHTLRWKKIIEASFSVESRYLVIKTSDDMIVGVCPLFSILKFKMIRILDSLPFSDFGGPLFRSDYLLEGTNVLLNYLKNTEHLMYTAYANIKTQNESVCNIFKNNGSIIDTSIGLMSLDLNEKNIDYVWNYIFTAKQRKYIRRFDNDGFCIRFAEKEEDLTKFYELHSINMKQKKVKPFPYGFYKNIFKELFPKYFNIALIEINGKCVGAGIFYIFPDKKTIYMTGVGLDKTLSSRYKLYFKLRWETIAYASMLNIKNICFGSTPTDKDSKNYIIKSSFGAEFDQQYLIHHPINKKHDYIYKSIVEYGKIILDVLPHKYTLALLDKLSENDE